jgi:uroporphyrinogen decarboxylase
MNGRERLLTTLAGKQADRVPVAPFLYCNAVYNDLDITGWGYLTPPPFGDVELDKALRVMRPDMALRGNIDQIEFLKKATPAEIRERVKQVLERVKPRGNWILSTTDFFFDGTPYQNIQAFADAGREFGVY